VQPSTKAHTHACPHAANLSSSSSSIRAAEYTTSQPQLVLARVNRAAPLIPGLMWGNAQLHYDCKYRGLLALSSREARLLGGNRTIAEPFEMTYGRVPSEYTRPIRYDTFTGVGMKVYKDAQVGQYYVEAITKNSPADIQGISACTPPALPSACANYKSGETIRGGSLNTTQHGHREYRSVPIHRPTAAPAAAPAPGATDPFAVAQAAAAVAVKTPQLRL
jgi:hypothetical protein